MDDIVYTQAKRIAAEISDDIDQQILFDILLERALDLYLCDNEMYAVYYIIWEELFVPDQFYKHEKSKIVRFLRSIKHRKYKFSDLLFVPYKQNDLDFKNAFSLEKAFKELWEYL